MTVVLYEKNSQIFLFILAAFLHPIYIPRICALLLFKFAKITTSYYLKIHLLLSCFRIINLHQTFLLEYIIILSREYSVNSQKGPTPTRTPRARRHAVPRRHGLLRRPEFSLQPMVQGKAMRKFTSWVFPAPQSGTPTQFTMR